MNRKPDQSFDRTFEKKSLPAQVLSPGKAVGVLCFVNEEIKDSIAADIPETEIAHEIKRFEHMIRSVAKELESAVKRLNEENYLEEAEILKTHVYMVKDKHFLKKVIEKIRNHGVAAHIAVEHALQEITAMFEQSDNAYISERKADFKDIAGQLIRKLHREDKEIFRTIMQTVENPIIVIPELLPSHLLEARDSRVAGFVVTKGTSLSHAAIFAKSFGLPVLKLKNFYAAGLKNRMEVFLDGYEGRIFLDPSEIQVKEYVKPEEKAVAIKPLPLNVQINIIAPEQVNENILKKTNGIGLYRTEYLFMSQEDDFPSEDDQYRVYSSLFEKCINVTMTARTLDVGADKELSYFSLGPQENPYLGFRAHRVYRFHPEIFITQVKAMLRAARKSKDFILLYPMIESTDDLSFVQELLCQAIDALHKENKDYLHNFRQGILIEVPSAVWNFEELLDQVDVACVGTNDLLQYFFAIDRNNANAYSAYRPEHPAVWHMIKSMVDTAKAVNKPLSVCGEIAADLYYIPLWIGLGLDSISIDIHTVDRVRHKILSVDPAACRQLTSEVLSARYAAEVRMILTRFSGIVQKNEDNVFKNDVEFIDPVCKMVVHTKNNDFRVNLEGREYFFCCKRCMGIFLNDFVKVKHASFPRCNI